MKKDEAATVKNTTRSEVKQMYLWEDRKRKKEISRVIRTTTLPMRSPRPANEVDMGGFFSSSSEGHRGHSASKKAGIPEKRLLKGAISGSLEVRNAKIR